MVFFIDLDGTLIDVSEKFYQTYVDLYRQNGFEPLPFERYWDLKKSKVSESNIALETKAHIEHFGRLRKDLIETAYYQKFDVLIGDVKQTLEKLSSYGDLMLVTIRHNRVRLMEQLEELGILHYFKVVLNDHREIKDKWKLKVQLIEEYFESGIPENSFFVGDTETDIKAGKVLQSKTFAVLSGMSNLEDLKSASPDFIIKDINVIFNYIQ